MNSRRLFTGLIPALVLVLTACSQPQHGPRPGVKVGKPYVVEGTTYYPEYDAFYDKIGQASWYGPGFHGKYTANGETFDQDDLTAAHPTLPMPSLVRVTNLENGRSAIIRVNDRGPFKKNRIIDLSKASAQRLGITSLAKVRVQFLKAETEEYMASVNRGQPLDMVAYNDAPPSAKIVESTVVSSRAGPVADAAPVMSVSSQTLDGNQQDVAAPVVLSQDIPPPAKPSFVQNAWANDNVTLPDAPSPENEPQAAPAPEQTPAAAPAPVQAFSPPPIKPSPTKLAPASGGGTFFIQAGSFASEENANKLSSRLGAITHSIVEKVAVGEKTWWRVRVGPFEDRDVAEAALSDVRAAGVPDARIAR